MLKSERREAQRRKRKQFTPDNRRSVHIIDALSFDPNKPKKSKRKHSR